MSLPVVTFEVLDRDVRPLGTHGSLAAASAHLPEGAYTTLRIYRGHRVLRFSEHVRRLEDSLRLLGRPAALPEERVRRGLAEAVRATGHPESRLRLTFGPPRLFVSVEPFEPPPQSLYRDGVACVGLTLRRPSPRSKDTRFIGEAARAYEALPTGVHEGLLLGDDGALLEGLSSNFFAVAGGVLRTEEERALPGVTRSLVLELAQGLVPVSAAAVHMNELDRVSESFITSVSRGILPVVRIDDRTIGDRRPGPVTRELIRRLEELVEREAVSVLW